MHHPQRVLLKTAKGYEPWDLPSPGSEVLPGVLWGRYEQLLTPAFWAVRARMVAPTADVQSFRLGQTLREEVAACLLGGHGIPAEVGLAAFWRVQRCGALERRTSADELFRLLSEPLQVSDHLVRYRFAQQKARYLAMALPRIRELEHLGGTLLRDELLKLAGVGPKTASWITRNWCGSDEVAILDVHICRACELAGVFPPGTSPAKNYIGLEGRFLAFAAALGSRASIVDTVMWETMRRLPRKLYTSHA